VTHSGTIHSAYDIGDAVAVWVEGDLVVNLWGGFADAAGLRTLAGRNSVSIYSGSKADEHMCASAGPTDGELDRTPRWPVLAGVRARQGKRDITVAWVGPPLWRDRHAHPVHGRRRDGDAVCGHSLPPSRGGARHRAGYHM